MRENIKGSNKGGCREQREGGGGGERTENLYKQKYPVFARDTIVFLVNINIQWLQL
jgi:hypothetical protein